MCICVCVCVCVYTFPFFPPPPPLPSVLMKMRTGGEWGGREALYISHFIIINVVEFRSRDANSSSRANNNRNTRTWHRFPLPRIFVPPNDRHFLLFASLALARKKQKKAPPPEFLHKLSRTRINPRPPFSKEKGVASQRFEN